MSDESLKETGRCAAAAIVEMVAALECDYDRMAEIDTEYLNGQIDLLIESDDATELVELREAAGECTSREDAETRIQEDALSVLVRSDWETIDTWSSDNFRPSEFEILLSTGGPATRIRGELDEHGQPRRAWLEVQDWGTPWTQVFGIDQDTLLAYARCFYYGEG